MNNFLEKFVEAKFNKPGTALDLGAGKGYDLAGLKLCHHWSVLGVDKKFNFVSHDLEKVFDSGDQFDLVYSNYTLQFIKNKKNFIKTCYNNLKDGGWLFIHTFSEKDKTCIGVNKKEIEKLLNNFKHIKIKERKIFDNEIGHQHWHNVLEITAQK
jgi:SAM-dependent methyltransferase